MLNLIFSGIGGAAFGAWIAYLFAVRLSTNKNKLIAASNFRAAFAPLISKMRLAQTNDEIVKRDILDSTFESLAVAIEIFRPYVPGKDQDEYQNAWEKYCMPDGKGKIRLSDYYRQTEIDGYKRDCHKLFTIRIEKILSFAPIP